MFSEFEKFILSFLLQDGDGNHCRFPQRHTYGFRVRLPAATLLRMGYYLDSME